MYPVYTQLSKALLVSFKAEFGPYEGEIARLSQEVRDEASLAFQQAQKQENELQAEERSDARRYRKIMAKFREDDYKSKEEVKNWRLEIYDRKLERKKLEALDALSAYDYQKTYRQIRKECIPGTSTWICESPEFNAWMSGTLKTLWFTGRCKYIMTPGTLATLKVKISRIREIGHKVQSLINFHGEVLLMYSKRLCGCTSDRESIAERRYGLFFLSLR